MTTVTDKHVQSIVQEFEELPDPRSSINRKHRLVDVIVISVCGVIAGADGPVGIEEWAKIHESWLRKFLKLPHGIPSHDTVGRVLEALQPSAFQKCFANWLNSLSPPSESGTAGRPHLAIDGKTMRRSHDRSAGLGPLHIVSVWATEQGIALGQLATEEKSNEITAIPELLREIDLDGAIVTIDAAGCQTKIAQSIIDGGGDYVLALKGNQPTLHEAVRNLFDDLLETSFADVCVSRWEEQETRHGRIEHRSYYQLTVPHELPGREKWSKLKTVGIAIRESQNVHETTSTVDVRYYISSLRRNGEQFARLVRGHWGIENTLHWSLDMTFREDESRVRGRRIADNLSWLRRIALTLIKQHSHKQTVAMKRRMAGWSVDFLMEIVTGKQLSMR